MRLLVDTVRTHDQVIGFGRSVSEQDVAFSAGLTNVGDRDAVAYGGSWHGIAHQAVYRSVGEREAGPAHAPHICRARIAKQAPMAVHDRLVLDGHGLGLYAFQQAELAEGTRGVAGQEQACAGVRIVDLPFDDVCIKAPPLERNGQRQAGHTAAYYQDFHVSSCPCSTAARF